MAKEFTGIDLLFEKLVGGITPNLHEQIEQLQQQSQQGRTEGKSESEIVEEETKSEQEKIQNEGKLEGITIDNIAEKIADVLGVSEREARNIILFIDFTLWLKDTDEDGNLQPTAFAKKYSIKTLTDFANNYFAKVVEKILTGKPSIIADVFQTDYKNLQTTAIPRASAWVYMTFMIFQAKKFRDSDNPQLQMFAQSYISGTSFVNRRFGTVMSRPYRFMALLRELDKVDGIEKLIHEYVNKQSFNPKKDADEDNE